MCVSGTKPLWHQVRQKLPSIFYCCAYICLLFISRVSLELLQGPGKGIIYRAHTNSSSVLPTEENASPSPNGPLTGHRSSESSGVSWDLVYRDRAWDVHGSFFFALSPHDTMFTGPILFRSCARNCNCYEIKSAMGMSFRGVFQFIPLLSQALTFFPPIFCNIPWALKWVM